MPPIVAGMLVLASLLVVLLAIARPLGSYIARVVMGERTVLSPILGPVERGTYRVLGIDADAEQTWAGYAVSVVVFALSSIVFLFVLLLSQGGLPLNPTGAVGMTPDLAFNTAVSFVSNTNWQNYAGETGVSHLTQMVGLTVQNFVSAATGLAIAIALVRGLVRRSASTVGDFWVDLVRITLYILLPIATVAAVFLVSQGVIQTLSGSVTVDTIVGGQQTIALGPVGSQEAIKELGTNGGGFFNANAAHPFENPNPLTDWVQLVLILAIPFALTYTFGRLAGDQRQGWVLFAAMAVILGTGALVAIGSEIRLNPEYAAGIDGALGNMEGKELRFGAVDGSIYRRGHDRHEHRLREFDARQLPADRRGRGDGPHGPRRDRPGRRRSRPVRHPRVRDPGRVHRRPDGRTDTRVPRQEGRGLRDEDGDDRRPRRGGQHPRVHGTRRP